MEVISKKRIPTKLRGFDVWPNADSAHKPPPPTVPKPPPPPPSRPKPPTRPAPLPPLAAKASTLPPRARLQPAQMTLSGLPLIGYPDQQHLPLQSGVLGGVQLYRCQCGLLMAEYAGHLWWIPVSTSPVRLETEAQLAEVLGFGCWSADLRRRIAQRKQRHTEQVAS